MNKRGSYIKLEEATLLKARSSSTHTHSDTMSEIERGRGMLGSGFCLGGNSTKVFLVGKLTNQQLRTVNHYR